MRVLIGYAMRSGSTLLAHVLGGHSRVRAYGDVSSIGALPKLLRGADETVVVKPPDLLFLSSRFSLDGCFDRHIWLTRDPRDSYLSAVESGYAYLFRRPGPFRDGIDVGLLKRWSRIHRRYLDHPDRWRLVRYEDLARHPLPTLDGLLAYLGLPRETLLPFQWRRSHWLRGGDYKIARTRNVTTRGIGRYRETLTAAQQQVFADILGDEMRVLKYAA